MIQRLWVVSELYYPEETSTGYLLTKIAEGLAQHFPVYVLCSQPTYAVRGVRAPYREKHHGVHIQRCWATTLNKDNVLFRLINLVPISVSIFVSACSRSTAATVYSWSPIRLCCLLSWSPRAAYVGRNACCVAMMCIQKL